MWLFGFRETLGESTREKRDCLPSLLEQEHISLFYRNSCKAILNPHQHRSKTIVLPKVFGEAFFKKLRYSQVYLVFGRRCITQFSKSKITSKFASRALPTRPSNLLSVIAPCLFSEQEMRTLFTVLPPIAICFAVT